MEAPAAKEEALADEAAQGAGVNAETRLAGEEETEVVEVNSPTRVPDRSYPFGLWLCFVSFFILFFCKHGAATIIASRSM